MTIKKTNHKSKFNFFSLVLAIAMLLSFNFPFAYSLANNVSFAADSSSEETTYTYKAEVDQYEFSTNQFSISNSDTSSSINSGKVDISARQDLISYVTNNKDSKIYYPIVKFNGITLQKEERDNIDNLSDIDTADNFGGMIVTNDYRVAKKNYKSTYNTVVKDDEELNVVYLLITQGSNTEAEHLEKIAELKTKVAKLNEVLGYTSTNLRYAVINQHESTYDGSDYTYIGTDTEDYSSIKTEASSDPVTAEESLAEFDITKYSLYFKRDYEWEENKLYLYTSTKSSGTSTLSLTNNSYYAVSVWVYTAGDATATLELTGTNFDAVVSGISTEGKWVQYYLFIATRPQDATSVNIRLYYGDTYGVTGKNKKMSDYGSEENHYLANRLSGAVFFDNLNLYTINYTDFINQTINGFAPNAIAKKYIASTISDITTIQNNKQAVLKTEIIDEKEVVSLDHYTYSTYNNDAELSVVDTYVDRFGATNWVNPTFDPTLQSLADQETDDLVYEAGEAEIDSLNFDTYLSNNAYPFSYYMPRYSAGTTWLTDAEKAVYRNLYANGSLTAKVVKEAETFPEYERVVLDELGNVVQEEQIVDEQTQKVDKKETVRNNTFGENNEILELKNTSSYDLGVVSCALFVPTAAVYRVSVWAYSEDSEATATARLFSAIKTKSASVYGQLITASNTATDFEYNSNSTNGWKEIVLYVKGNPVASQFVYLTLLASKNTTVYFDNIKVESITSSSFVSSSGIDLSSYGILTSNITNGNFNSFSITAEDDTATYPYTADSWTIISNSTSTGVVRGVISTDDNNYEKVVPARDKDGNIEYLDQERIFIDGGVEKYTEEDDTVITLEYGVNYLKDFAGKYVRATTVKKLFGNQTVPKTVIDVNGTDVELTRENVYAVSLPDTGDEEQSKFLMRSSSINFSANKLYKLTFQVWFGTNFDGKFVARLTNGTSDDAKTIASINLKVDGTTETATEGTWQTFTVFVRTGNESVGMPLLLGSENSKGTMFVQKVDYVELSEKTYGNVKVSIDDQYDEEFNNACVNGFDSVVSGEVRVTRFVDLKNNNFSNHSAKADENGIFEAYGYALETISESASYTQGQVGVVDLNKGFTYNETAATGAVLNPNTAATTALVIINNDTTDFTAVNSVFDNTISNKKCVKVTIDVLTSDMGEDKGLTIFANGFDVEIDNISESTGWKTYTFYLRTGETSIGTFALNFALGREENGYTGWAMLSNMKIVELTEDEYNTATTAEGISEDKTVAIKSLAKEETSDDSSSDASSQSNFSWQLFFYVLSSILLVGSLVVALVAIIVKRKRKKGPAKEIATEDKTKSEGGIQ